MASLTNKPDENKSDLFRCGVERVLLNWTALKLAVENGTAGPKSREVAMNFVSYIGDIFCDGGNFEDDDLCDVLVDVMDTQFDTWCEDDSPREVASFLCKLYKLFSQDKLDEMRREIDRLPECNTSVSQKMPINNNQNLAHFTPLESVPETSHNEEGTSNDEMEVEAELEPGWTKVISRRKHTP